MENYRNEFRNTERDFIWTAPRIFLALLAIIAALGTTGYFMGWFRETTNVVQEEYGPKAMLKKYTWFVDKSNAIKKMDEDVAIFRSRVALVDSAYGPTDKMDVITKELYRNKKLNAETDLAAVISTRNNLVKDYNAQSEKFNWAPFNSKPDKPEYQIDLIGPQ